MRILPKVDQVIYILDTIFAINFMTLAEAVLEIFCSQAVIKMKKLKKGNNSPMTNPMDKEKNTGLLNFYTHPTYQISRSYL